MRERRRSYELMYIISPLRSSEDEIAATIGRVQQAVTALGGEVSNVEHSSPWGRRKFAYPIREYAEGEASRRSFTEGYYVLTTLKLPTSKVGGLERALQLNEAVLRFLVTVVEQKRQNAAVPLKLTDDEEEDLGEDEEIDDVDLDEDAEA